MKNIMRKLAVILLAVVIAVPAMTANASAASTVSITGDDQVAGGDIFTVTVTFDGDDIGRVVGDITYDTDMLSYISGGSSSGNVGYVELRNAGTGEALTFELEFQALKEGSTQLDVSTSEMYDLNESYMDTPSTSKTITISGNADEGEIVEETMVEDNAVDGILSVDENPDVEASGNEDGDQGSETDNSGFLAKAIMFGVGVLVLILIIVMILRRKK